MLNALNAVKTIDIVSFAAVEGLVWFCVGFVVWGCRLGSSGFADCRVQGFQWVGSHFVCLVLSSTFPVRSVGDQWGCSRFSSIDGKCRCFRFRASAKQSISGGCQVVGHPQGPDVGAWMGTELHWGYDAGLRQSGTFSCEID